MTSSVTVAVAGVPEEVNEWLSVLVDELRFPVERERTRATPAEAREALRDIEGRARELLANLDALDWTPRAHLVANLPAGELREVAAALILLRAAAVAGAGQVPSHVGRSEAGVPRYAATRVVAIFRHAGLPTTVTNNEEGRDTPITQALKAVLAAAGYPLSTSSVNKYLIAAAEIDWRRD